MKTAKQIGENPIHPMVASTGDPRDGVYCHDGLPYRLHLIAQIAGGLDPQGLAHEDWIAEKAINRADAILAALAKETEK